MVPLSAEIHSENNIFDGRTAVRRSLRLGVSAYASDQVATALVLNISETGVLIETMLDLGIGETLKVDIPEASGSSVRVVWRERHFFGCEFFDPVSTGAVSAARLKSANEPPGQSDRSLASAADAPYERRQRPSMEGAETLVAIVAAFIAMLSLFIFIAAIATL
jgi:hypothetical protein